VLENPFIRYKVDIVKSWFEGITLKEFPGIYPDLSIIFESVTAVTLSPILSTWGGECLRVSQGNHSEGVPWNLP
jgi:hypothetical protein